MAFYKKLLKKAEKFFVARYKESRQAEARFEKRFGIGVPTPMAGMKVLKAVKITKAAKGLRSATRKIARGERMMKGEERWFTPSALSQTLKKTIKYQIGKGIDPRGGGKTFRPELRKEYTRLLRKLIKK